MNSSSEQDSRYIPKYISFDPKAIPQHRVNFLEANAGTGKTTSLITIYKYFISEGLTPRDILTLSFTNNAVKEIKQRLKLTKSDEADEIYTFHSFILQVIGQNALETNEPFQEEIIPQKTEELFKSAFLNFLKSNLAKEDKLFLNYLKIKKKFKSSDYYGAYSNDLYGNLEELSQRVSLNPYPTVKNKKSFLEEKRNYLKVREALKKFIIKNQALLLSELKKLDLKKTAYRNLEDKFNNFSYELRHKPFDFPLEYTVDFSREKIEKNLKKGVDLENQEVLELLDLIEKHDQAWNSLEHIFLSNYFFYVHQANEFIEHKVKAIKNSNRILFFDDLIKKIKELIKEKNQSSFWENMRKRYQVIIVDEFQDTDEVQVGLIKKLLSLNSGLKVYLIGDPKQSIYGFREANINVYFAARKLTDKVYTLTKNYRSCEALIEAINFLYASSLDEKRDPFLDERITFNKSEFAGEFFNSAETEAAAKKVAWDKLQQNKFILKVMSDKSKGSSKIKIDDKKKIIIQKVVAQIEALPPSERDEVAILVPKNQEVKNFKKALSERGLPVEQELDDQDDLYLEEKEIILLMEAMLDPNNEEKIKPLYLTSILGSQITRSSDEMPSKKRWKKPLAEKTSFNSHFKVIQQHAKLWQEKGIYFSLITFMLDPRKNSNLNLLSLSGKEGIKYRLKHEAHLKIIEKLHNLERKILAGPALLLRLFKEDNSLEKYSEVKNDGAILSEGISHRGTLGKGIKVLTIHKCKGLEFKRVILPFSSFKLNFSNKPIIFFDDEAGLTHYYLDLGSENQFEHKKLSRRELERENLRLLYVALTRAKLSLTVYYLPEEESIFNLVGLFNLESLKKRDEYFLIEEIALNETQEEKNDGGDAAATPSKDKEERNENQLCLNVLEKPLVSRGYLASFSSIKNDINNLDFADVGFYSLGESWARGIEQQGIEQQGKATSNLAGSLAESGGEYEGQLEINNKLEGLEFLSLNALPKGKDSIKIGVMLHAILEKWQPDISGKDLEEFIIAILLEQGVDIKYKELIATFLEKIKKLYLATPERKTDSEISASNLEEKWEKNICLDFSKLEAEKKILREMEFTLRIRKSKKETIQTFLELLHEAGYLLSRFVKKVDLINPTLNEIEIEDGFLKGFIDLVFEVDNKYYLIDWKSNYLGPNEVDYSKERLHSCLLEQNYFLQAFIYTVALDAFLSIQLGENYNYEKNFGGCHYVFLRGISLAKPENEKIPPAENHYAYGFKFSEKIINQFKKKFII